jgi:hypothetical protein
MVSKAVAALGGMARVEAKVMVDRADRDAVAGDKADRDLVARDRADSSGIVRGLLRRVLRHRHRVWVRLRWQLRDHRQWMAAPVRMQLALRKAALNSKRP